MAVFLLSVVTGWIATFAFWFVWSFGPLTGLLLGALSGSATVFVILLLLWSTAPRISAQKKGERASLEDIHVMTSRGRASRP